MHLEVRFDTGYAHAGLRGVPLDAAITHLSIKVRACRGLAVTLSNEAPVTAPMVLLTWDMCCMHMSELLKTLVLSEKCYTLTSFSGYTHYRIAVHHSRAHL